MVLSFIVSPSRVFFLSTSHTSLREVGPAFMLDNVFTGHRQETKIIFLLELCYFDGPFDEDPESLITLPRRIPACHDRSRYWTFVSSDHSFRMLMCQHPRIPGLDLDDLSVLPSDLPQWVIAYVLRNGNSLKLEKDLDNAKPPNNKEVSVVPVPN